VTIQLNPTVSDSYEKKTLKDLRQMVFDALGFIQRTTTGPTSLSSFYVMRCEIMARLGLATALLGSTSTLGAVRQQLLDQMGLATPVPVVTQTVGVLRTWLYNELGYGAMSVIPPGVIGLLNGFINEAMQTLFNRIEFDEGTATRPTAITATDTSQDSTSTGVLDYAPVLQLATALAKNHYAQDDAQKYFDQVEKFIADQRERKPINVTKTLNQIINQAQQTIFARIEYDQGRTYTTSTATPSVLNTQVPAVPPATLVSDGDATVVDTTVLVQLASALAKAHFNQQDAKLYLDEFERYMHDLTDRLPPNIVNIILAHIADAQRVVARRYEFGATDISGWSFGSLDSDVINNSIDPEPVYLLALANLKKKVGQADADAIYAQFERYFADLEKRQPINAVSVVNRLLKQAQDMLYRAYKVFRMERWYTWTTVSGVKFYGINNDDDAQLSPPVGVTVAIGSPNASVKMSAPRRYQMSVKLGDGTVLIAGGGSGLGAIATADIYDPSTGVFSRVGDMNFPRLYGCMTLLKDGTVLVAGGDFGTSLSTAELYDPTTKTFTLVGSMLTPRENFTCTLLQNGNILVSGGFNAGAATFLNSAEIYSHASKTFSATGSMTGARDFHTATLLPTGKVLVAGGRSAPTVAIATAELYDPVAGTFASTGSMVGSRREHTAHLIGSGKVLVISGLSGGVGLATAELYDPAAGTFSSTGSMSTPRTEHTSVVLLTGDVLVSGGTASTVAELYSLNNGSFSVTTGAMPNTTLRPTSVLLNSGLAMIIGGSDSGSSAVLNTVMFYNPATGTLYTNGGLLTIADDYYKVVAYTEGGVEIVGGIVTTISPGHTTALANVVGTGSIDAAGVMTITAVTNGAYAVGQIVTGTAVLAGTSIIKQLTGTAGGAGTYQLSALHAVASTTLSAAVITGVPANTSVIVSWTPLIDSRVTAYGVFGRTLGAEQLIAIVPNTQTSYEDLGTITPSGALPTTNNTGNIKRIDPREITWAGISKGDNTWRQMIDGIPPEVYSTPANGVPQRYEIRDAIEVWPTPTDNNWLIRIKGYFQPSAFEADTDTNTIDAQAIYLKAVADAKATLKLNGKPLFTPLEVQLAQSEAKAYIGDLVAGTHMTRRYIPGDRMANNAIRPVLLDANGNPVN
jgi:hypothetical protein